MRLFLARHARVEPDADQGSVSRPSFPRLARAMTGGTGIDCAENSLSERGLAQAHYLGEILGAVQPRIDRVLCAPGPECRATAGALQSRLSAELRVCEPLDAGAPVAEALALLHEHANARSLVIVGANPLLGELLTTLAGGIGARHLTVRQGELVEMHVRIAQPIGTGRILRRWRLEALERVGAGLPLRRSA